MCLTCHLRFPFPAPLSKENKFFYTFVKPLIPLSTAPLPIKYRIAFSSHIFLPKNIAFLFRMLRIMASIAPLTALTRNL